MASEHELEQIMDFVRKQFNKLSGADPLIFPVSSRQALAAKQELGPAVKTMDPVALVSALEKNDRWVHSRFGNVENYIKKTLSEEERAWLKLRNPIGIAEHLLLKYLTVRMRHIYSNYRRKSKGD